MILDHLIYILAALLLLISVFRREALIPALIVCASLAFDRIIFQERMSTSEAVKWAFMLSLKDIVFALVIAFRHKPKEYPIAMGFFVLCLVHQWIRIEALNHDLTLLYYRNDLASIIVASWIASISLIIFTGDSNNGGKRVRMDMSRLNRPYRNRIYNPAYKVTK